LASEKPAIFLDKIVSCPHLEITQDGGLHERTLSTMMQLQAPLPLAQLPRPLDVEGKTLFNSVYGLSASGKVKRFEIVAAVDGEAVNLYDVNTAPSIPSLVCIEADV
jgi:hypothetical protein